MNRALTCEHCGYDLAGLSAAICPECGMNVPTPSRTPTPRTDARRAYSKWSGIAGWFLLGASTVAMLTFLASRTMLALVCPGIFLAIVLVSFWPWYAVMRRARLSRSLADDLFVAIWPWIYIAAVSLVVLL